MITAALNPLAHGPNPVAIPLRMRPFPAATSLPGIASPLTAVVTRWVPPTPPLPVGFFSRFCVGHPERSEGSAFPSPSPSPRFIRNTTHHAQPLILHLVLEAT
jgi:hypothetical protein